MKLKLYTNSHSVSCSKIEVAIDYKSLEALTPKSELLKIKIQRKLREVEDDLKDLISYAQDAKAGRKLVYNLGYGVPRESFRNIVYKCEHNHAKGVLELCIFI